MNDDQPVTQWLRLLEEGNQDAARALWDRYHHQVSLLAHGRLGNAERRVMDEDDVTLSVMRSLFAGAATRQYAGIVNRQQIWQLLATITLRKVIDRHRFLRQQKRGGGLVRGHSGLQQCDENGEGVGFDQFCAQDPTPETLAIAAEEFQRLMSCLDDDRLREIAQRKLDGFLNEEIGERLGLTTRSIERKLRRIREIWAAELDP